MYLCRIFNVFCMARRSFELVKRQREDLFAVYREVCASCRSQREAWQKMINHPAPRYYITPKQAHEMLSPMLRGDTSEIDKLKPHVRQMYIDLFDELNRMSQKTEFIGKSLWFICQFLVTRPAPRFYLTERYLGLTFNTCKKYGKNHHYAEVYPKSAR